VIFTFFLILSHYGLFGAIFSILFTQIILFMIMSAIIASEIGVAVPHFTDLGKYLKFALPTMPNELSSFVVDSSDRFLIGFFLGASFVAFYSPGYVLGSIIIMFLAPISLLLTPTLSKYYDEGEISQVKVVLRYSVKYFLALSIPSVFLLSLLARPLLMTLTTQEIALQSSAMVPFVVISYLFFGIAAFYGEIIVLAKKTEYLGIGWICAAALNLIINAILIPRIGILGAAISTLIAYAFMLGFIYQRSLATLRFEIDISFVCKSVVASLPMALVVFALNPEYLLGVVAATAIGLLIYAAGIAILRGFNKDELHFFTELLHS
jgi:O-antigen/teichoic acid export membrane protein